MNIFITCLNYYYWRVEYLPELIDMTFKVRIIMYVAPHTFSVDRAFLIFVLNVYGGK